MFTLPNSTEGMQLLVRALSASIAMAVERGPVYLDLSGIDEDSPAARKAIVAERLSSVLGELEAVIRSKITAPDASPAVLGSRLVANGEVFDSTNKTYTPGLGFGTLLKAIAADADADVERGRM